MLVSIDNFLKINFEISLETYFRLTDSKLKEMLKAEIKNFLEEQQEEKFNELAKNLGMTKEELEQMILDKELFIKVFSLFNSMSKRGKYVTIETLIMHLVEEE